MAHAGEFSRSVRRIILDQSNRAHVGHIGSALSIADIISVLYAEIFAGLDPDDPDRDRFVLSKGHASLAVYAALFLRRWVTEEELNSFCGDGTAFGVHPEALVRGVDFTTGSLGHGLAMGAGAALAARLERSTRRIFVLISDAELNEGSIWESVMFAAHHQLSNLVVIVDLDGQQALGYTKDVLDLCELAPRWKAFGWNVSEIDGHDPEAISQTIASLDTKSGRPHVIIANTVFGKGVSFMQSQIEWHYMPMSDDQYQQAVDEVSAMS